MDDGSSDGTLSCCSSSTAGVRISGTLPSPEILARRRLCTPAFRRRGGLCGCHGRGSPGSPGTQRSTVFQTLKKGEYDCVATRREDRRGEARIRSFLSASFYKCINKLSKVKIEEGARDFRMMNRKMTDALLSLSEKNRFSKGLFGWVGFKTKWLPYHNVERAAGDTKWSVAKLLRYSLDGILGFSTIPLSVASYGGILLCGVAFVMILFLVIKNLIWHDPVAGWPAMMCAIIFIGGVQLLCMGIMGQYLARAYTEIKDRPIYILRSSSDEEDEKQQENFVSIGTYSHTDPSLSDENMRRVSGRI